MSPASPPPWKLYLDLAPDGEEGTGPCYKILDSNNGLVAWDIESEADACLIATAPKLLALARDLAAATSGPLGERALRLIAQAEGRS